MSEIAVFAGSAAAAIFMAYAVYVLSLPPGPVWAIHGFYLTSTALMLFWWLRYTRASRRKGPRTERTASSDELVRA